MFNMILNTLQVPIINSARAADESEYKFSFLIVQYKIYTDSVYMLSKHFFHF